LDELQGQDSAFLRERFEEAHSQRYNFELPDSPLEIATVRVIGRGTIKGVTLSESEDGSGEDVSGAVMRTEQAYFSGWVETPLLDRNKLRPGNEIVGPAVVVQDDTTTVIEPGYRGAVDRFGNILIERG
jgi:N-methylhydantoinase A